MHNGSHGSGDARMVFGVSSTIYTPILLLGLLILVSGSVGLYSIRSQQDYVEHVGLELVPALTVATEAENSLYMAVNAERGLLLTGADQLRHARLLNTHAAHIETAVAQMARLTKYVENKHMPAVTQGPGSHSDHTRPDYTGSNHTLTTLLDSWSSASQRVAKLADSQPIDTAQIQFALSESTIAFTALNTRIGDMKASIINLSQNDTRAELVVIGIFRYVLLATTLAGLLMSWLSISYLRRKLNQLGNRLNLHVRRKEFTRQIGEALEMEDTAEGLNQLTSRVLNELCDDNPAELLIAEPDNTLSRVAQNSAAGTANCGVDKTLSCVAMRRGQLSIFTDSSAINTCPYLLARNDILNSASNNVSGSASDCASNSASNSASGNAHSVSGSASSNSSQSAPCNSSIAAICAPVTFMGSGLGVTHTIYPIDQLPAEDRQEQLRAFSSQLAARLGNVRAFGHSQSLAITDPLTELLNRRGLEQRAAEINGKPYSLAMIDIDFFKRLNDSYGHETGDLALKAFADALRASLPQRAVMSRWGGEEFSVILPDIDCEHALQHIEAVRSGLAQRLQSGELPVFTASVGLADTTMGDSFLTLTMLADQALYQAKSDGRDCVVVAGELTEQNKQNKAV